MRIFWSGAFAILMTAIVSGVWAALLLTNLSHAPTFPWSALVMGLLLWALWTFLDGKWGPVRNRAARSAYLRAAPLPRRVYSWALVAGLLWLFFLAGFWIVLEQMVSGYFQGALERSGLGAAAILCTVPLMAPIHALTQGFFWPTLLFYLLADGMLGALAYFTKSIRAGVLVHAVGLFAVLFAVLSLYALKRLAAVARQVSDANPA